MIGHVGSHHFPKSPARLQRDEAEVLAALQKEPQSTDDLVMVCNMGRAAVQIHLQHLLGCRQDRAREDHRATTAEGRTRSVQVAT